MSLTENMTQLLTDMQAMNVELVKKTGGPAGEDTIVAQAPNADKLDGMTAGRVSDLLRERIRAHIDTLGQNAHKTLPSDLGTYADSEFTTKLDGLLDINGTSPLSFYGDREYLPPTVTGSFESGVNWAPWGYVGMFLEDNGTLMMLRTGTDGVKAGVYYSYLRNALNTRLMSSIVMTNARYHPAYFPAGSVARSVLWSNQDLIIGILHNANTLAITGYFISLTNNTFDQTKHTGVVIPANTIINPVVTGECVLRGQPIGFLKDNTVYLLVNKDNANTRAAGWKVYSIPKQQLIDSNYQGATAITGWTINRGAAGVVSRTDLDLAEDKFDMLNPTDPARMQAVEIDRANPAHYAKTLDTGTMWMNHGLYYSYWDNDLVAQYLQFLANFAFVFDPVSKVVDISKYWNQKPAITFLNNAWKVSDAPCCRYLNQGGSHVSQYAGQDSARFYLSENNVIFYYRTYVLYTNRQLGRATYAANASFEDIMLGEVDFTDIIAEAYEGRFASPVSFLPAAVSNFGDFVMTGLNTGWTKDNKVSRRWFRAGTDNTFTYQYGSLQGLGFLGNPPTPDRAWLDEYAGANKTNMYRTVNETDGAGWLVHQARYESYINPELSGSASINTAMVGSGSVSITADAYNGLNAQLRADLVANLGAPYDQAAINLWYEVVIPQRYTDLPAFVYGHYVRADRTTHFFIYSLTVNARGAVTVANISAASRKYIMSPFGNGSAVGISGSVGDSGQVAIRRVNSGFLIGLTTISRYTYIGNSMASCMLIAWKPGSGWSFPVGYDYDQQQISITGFVNMSHGLYVIYTTENHRGSLDCGTKLIGTLVSNGGDPDAANIDEYRARLRNANNGRIFLSQQTVTAWTVYFADPTPVMIEGQYYELGVYAHYLNAATDANKTFYCWAVKLSGVISYYVTTNPAIPTGFDASLYLGYFTTNSAGLATVAIEKRVAVGGTLISTATRGNSIPVTAGVPNTPGRLTWR